MMQIAERIYCSDLVLMGAHYEAFNVFNTPLMLIYYESRALKRGKNYKVAVFYGCFT